MHRRVAAYDLTALRRHAAENLSLVDCDRLVVAVHGVITDRLIGD